MGSVRLFVNSIGYNEAIRAKVDGIALYGQRALGCQILKANKKQKDTVIAITAPESKKYIRYFEGLVPPQDKKNHIQIFTLPEKQQELAELLLESKEFADLLKGKNITHGCFMSTKPQIELSKKLGSKYIEANEESLKYGTKHGSHLIFAEAKVPTPQCTAEVFNAKDLAKTLLVLAQKNVNKFYIKLNEGLSGDGNAVLTLPKDFDPKAKDAATKLEKLFETMCFAGDAKASDQQKKCQWEEFAKNIETGGVIAEEAIVSDNKEALTSPSAQAFINAEGTVRLISHHDQRLIGDGIYKGAQYPADVRYRKKMCEALGKIGQALAEQGVQGHFGVDFVVKGDDIYAIEINLRQTGTTFPYKMLEQLIQKPSMNEEGQLCGTDGKPKCYINDDNIQNDRYKIIHHADILQVLDPHYKPTQKDSSRDYFTDEALTYWKKTLAWDAETETGIVPQLLVGLLDKVGKVGVTAYANSMEQAQQKLDAFAAFLDVLAKCKELRKKGIAAKIGLNGMHIPV